MEEEPYKVHVVVDPAYGERLRALPKGEPVWVVDSVENRPVIRSLWSEDKVERHLDGITSFQFDQTATPEDWLLAELPAIDIHHDEYSHNPPYSVLNVIGVQWSRRISKALSEYGFDSHEPTARGFIATRKIVPLTK